LGEGEKPEKVKNFVVSRTGDSRDAKIKWDKVKNAVGYNIRWGIAPDKLYNSWLLYEEAELVLRSLDKNTTYWFTIEAFNENGVSEKFKTIEVK
jgi:hypothetical protein